MSQNARKYSRAEIVRLYESGLFAGEIAQQLGCHRSSVYTNLRAAGIEPRGDAKNLPGQRRRETCGRELHPLLVDGKDTEHVRYDGNGKRYCYSCAQMRWALRAALKSFDDGTL